MANLLSLLLFSFLFQPPTDHHVRGTVSDNLTGDGVTALMTLMTADSAVIDTVTATLYHNRFTGGTGASFAFRKAVSQKGRYLVKAEKAGYVARCVSFTIVSNRERDVSLTDIALQRAWRELPEVTVRATKVKMVVHGDTIVYNADAFNLAEGSMLDALVARLPGVRLTKDGQIYVNGRYVESLLVNGHDFFSGNAKLALQNLPAYTVRQVKVYDKAGAASRMMGRDMGDKQLVMDVRLKKEYAQGSMGNAEGGAATSHRYRLHAFGMRFSERMRLFGFANLNNLNEHQTPDLNGDWNPEDMPDGLLATKTAGLSWARFTSNMDTWVSSQTVYTHTGADNETRQRAQTYLPGGDSWRTSRSVEKGSSDLWQNKEGFSVSGIGLYSTSFIEASYQRRDGWSHERGTTADSATTLNSLLAQGSSRVRDLRLAFSSYNGFPILHTDLLRVDFSAEYNRLRQRDFSSTDIAYAAGLPGDDRNSFLHAPHQRLELSGSASYDWFFRGFNLRPGYAYTYSYNKTHHLFYRLDWLAGRDSSRFDALPSAADALAAVLDAPNSYRYREYRNSHTVDVYYYRRQWRLLGASVTARLPLRVAGAHLFYDRQGHHSVARHAVFFEPSLQMSHWSDSLQWRLEAEMRSDMPDLTALVPWRDDSDPLHIRLGGGHLSNLHRYGAKGSVTFRGRRQRALSLWADWSQTDHAVAYALLFDKRSGVSTLQPVNIDGNWSLHGGLGYARALGKAEHWTTDNSLEVCYDRNADMAEGRRSVVDNWKLGGNVKLDFRPDDRYGLTLHGGGTCYLAHGRREDFADIHAADFQVGFNALLQLPWKLQLSTDMTMFARRGWQQRAMNTTDWVWNLQLSRAFLDGKIVARVQGFDLLHELSTTQYAVNGQGRTETWHASLPRYVMVSVAWRFSVNPKQIATDF